MKLVIKPTFRTEILPILILVLVIISSFYFYQNFPEQVPIHWNAKGEVDNYAGKTFGAFLFPGIIIFLYLLFLVLPNLDPRKEHYQKFSNVYHYFKTGLILFMAAIYFVTSLSALGYPMNIKLIVPLGVGLLFILIGALLPKIKSNWFFGIRTPWTLSSEKVWQKTHEVGGKIFILGGLALMVLGWLPSNYVMPVLIINVGLMVLGTVGYSYWVYRKVGKK